jgi:hypothetical protein
MHAEIDNTKSVREYLDSLSEPSHGIEFKNLSILKDDLRDFLKTNRLPVQLVENPEQWQKAFELLCEIYKDTPLYLRSDKYTKVVLSDVSKSPGGSFAWSWSKAIDVPRK